MSKNSKAKSLWLPVLAWHWRGNRQRLASDGASVAITFFKGPEAAASS